MFFGFCSKDKSGLGASEERRKGHGSSLARLETASELKKIPLTHNIASRRLYKLQEKINGHAVFKGTVCQFFGITDLECYFLAANKVRKRKNCARQLGPQHRLGFRERALLLIFLTLFTVRI